MPHNVRTHTRRTASGKTVTVRQHDRKGGSGGDPILQGAARAVRNHRAKQAAVLSIATVAILLTAIISGSVFAIVAGAVAVLGGLIFLIGSFKTPKVRYAKQSEDWWDDGARG